jgi:hypothetical protein
MARTFQVIGTDVLGDVLGLEDDDDVSGDMVVTGRGKAKRIVRAPRQNLVVATRPAWRDGQLAPGVVEADEGMVPLQLNGQGGTNVFTSTLNRIVFSGTTQKPFRGERLLVSTVRTGVTAVGRVLGQLFIGTDLQQADINAFDIEQVGSPQAFGVRLTMTPNQPGVAINLICNLSSLLGTTDTIAVQVMLLGRIVH